MLYESVLEWGDPLFEPWEEHQFNLLGCIQTTNSFVSEVLQMHFWPWKAQLLLFNSQTCWARFSWPKKVGKSFPNLTVWRSLMTGVTYCVLLVVCRLVFLA